MTNRNEVYTGFIKELHDARDYKTRDFFGAGTPFDWEQGFDIEEKLGIKLIINNQGSTYSCVGQATSKDREVKEYIETKKYAPRSARSIYSFRSNKGHGMNPRDAKEIEKERGVASRKDVPDSQSELEMSTIPTWPYPVTRSKDYLCFDPYNNIDEVAKHIRDYDGVTIAYDGINNGTNRLEHPTLPNSPYEVRWSHFVFAGKAKIVDGEKRIYILNSWGSECGNEGWQYFTEADFKTRKNNYNPFYRGWVTTDLNNNDTKSMAEKFIEENEGELIQMTGKDGTGEIGVIAKGRLLVGNQLKVLITWAVRKFGKGIPKKVWEAAPKKDIESKE